MIYLVLYTRYIISNLGIRIYNGIRWSYDLVFFSLNIFIYL